MKPNDSNAATQGTPTSFRSLVERTTDMGLVSRKQWALAADQDEEAVRRWLAGQVPSTRAVRRMLSRASLLPDIVKDQVWAWFCNGSGRTAVAAEPPAATVLDPNHDGLVDAKDVSVFSLRAIEHAAAAAGELRDAIAGGRLTAAEQSTARVALELAAEQVRLAIAALELSGPRLATA